MNQTIGKTKIIWKKTSFFTELGLMLAGTLAIAVLVVSLMALAKVVQASSLEQSPSTKPSISVMDTKADSQPQDVRLT